MVFNLTVKGQDDIYVLEDGNLAFYLNQGL
ncbi:MAG: hypothetical protein ACI8QH_001239 [Flammeovirgaceae bacterium]|jgi:hypothetical protein